MTIHHISWFEIIPFLAVLIALLLASVSGVGKEKR